MNVLVHFGIYGHLRCFESSQIALAIENFQNILQLINPVMHLLSYDYNNNNNNLTVMAMIAIMIYNNNLMVMVTIVIIAMIVIMR